jgi:hypothetical protein
VSVGGREMCHAGTMDEIGRAGESLLGSWRPAGTARGSRWMGWVDTAKTTGRGRPAARRVALGSAEDGRGLASVVWSVSQSVRRLLSDSDAVSEVGGPAKERVATRYTCEPRDVCAGWLCILSSVAVTVSPVVRLARIADKMCSSLRVQLPQVQGDEVKGVLELNVS